MKAPIRVAHVATVDLTLRFLLLGQLRRLRVEGFEVAAISAPGPWVGDLEREGIRHIAWMHATRAWDPLDDARALAELVGIFRRERFHLVHTHAPKPGILGRVAARVAGVPCVVNTVHGLYATPDDPLRRRLPVLLLEGMAARLSDLELFQSAEDLAWARRRRVVAPARSVLLGNGADLRRFDPAGITPERLGALRDELAIPAGATVVGTVGRMVAEKGYRELFAAARLVRSVAPDVRFLAVGEPDREKPDAIRDDELTAARPDVLVTDWREDVPELLALMDVFVLASWREGMPRSAIEAAAMGKPLVLSDIRGCREVVRHPDEGILVPPRDAERLAEAILELVRDPERRARQGRAARRGALDRFDEHKVAGRVVACYRELLTRRGIVREQSSGTVLRPARRRDAAQLAALHRTALPQAFLPALGDGFLRQLYRGLAADPDAIVLVAESGDSVVGFAAGVPSVHRFYRRFYLRRGLLAAIAAVPALARPGVLRRIRETSRYPARAGSLPEAELLAIAVAPGWRARSVGAELARGVLRALGKRGAGKAKVVVSADNEGANRFYRRLGFREAGLIAVHDGVASNVLVTTCPS